MLDFQRTLLLIGLVVVSYLLWGAWQNEHPSVAPQASNTVMAQSNSPVASAGSEDAPSADVPTFSGDAPPMGNAPTAPAMDTAIPSSSNNTIENAIEVKTDVYDLIIDPLGGNIVQAKLLAYPETYEYPDIPLTLLNNNPGSIYVAQSGLTGPDGPDSSSGQVSYTSAQTYYDMGNNNSLQVDLNYQRSDGLRVTKTFTFNQGTYVVDVGYTIDNQTSEAWQGQFYGQLKRQEPAAERAGFFTFPGYTGGAVSSPDKRYEKLKFDEMRQGQLDRQVTGGWLAMIQRYFLSAWVPNPTENYRYFTQVSGTDNSVWLGMLGPWLQAAPGEQVTTQSQLYIGPEITSDLKTIAPGLELTVDYGWFWPISQFLFWVMKHIHDVLGNWGLSIIGVTLLIKILFYPLSAAGFRSMANMRRMQPKIAALKDRYGSDRQKMSQAMIEMYKKEKINPLGGCLPILIQIPVFIALYWVLIESVELRQAPFFFWIHDLSIKDPFYVLPVVMGLSMFLQQKLNPAPPDPLQAKVLMMMPVVFTVMFLNFPAGLMVYWIANNVLSMSQQYIVNQKIMKQAETKSHKGNNKKALTKK